MPLALGTATPSWLRRNEEVSPPGVNIYDLEQPNEVFGVRCAQIELHQQWVSVVLPAGTDLRVMATAMKLQRTPNETARQFYRFAGKSGPMLSIYEVMGNPLEIGTSHDPGKSEPMSLLGCNYAKMTEAEFLRTVNEVDAMMNQMASGMRQMGKGFEAAPKR